MKITFKNLGTVRQADLTLGDLTIVCGKNNTGKTYITYATYGLLDYWHNGASINVPGEYITQVIEKGTAIIPIERIFKNEKSAIKKVTQYYSSIVGRVFAGLEKHFESSSIDVQLTNSNSNSNSNSKSNSKKKDVSEVSFRAGAGSKSILGVKKSDNGKNIVISLLINQDSEELPAKYYIEDLINSGVWEILFKHKVPRPFIASAERTGSVIFQKELDFTRNRLVDLIGDRESKILPSHLFHGFKAEYPIPVRKNVDFIRDLPNIVTKESIFSKNHPEVLAHFSDIIGGEYKVAKDGDIQYIPSNKKTIKLSMVESSSAVRSLLDIGFYLRHVAQPGDLLMVDEPELNLHPENQRKIARLFAMLVNAGIKVFITTHSDFIIKELNSLILLNKRTKRLKALAKREGYSESEFLDAKSVKVYMACENNVLVEGNSKKTKCNTLMPADISEETGISIATFDLTIEEMNRIQDEIFWGE